jgi:hypothetical protein
MPREAHNCRANPLRDIVVRAIRHRRRGICVADVSVFAVAAALFLAIGKRRRCFSHVIFKGKAGFSCATGDQAPICCLAADVFSILLTP